MPLPNLLIVGSQKCGTTWLHECLRKSRHIFGSTPKELNYFNKPDYLDHRDIYESAFEGANGAQWRMESTPHYYRLPERGFDIARRIRDLLGPDARLMVIFRDPVERYLSSYTHHMMQGRFPYTPHITHLTDEYRMLSLGDYASITLHWRKYFPDLGLFFYDDLISDKKSLVSKVMTFLDTENDIPVSETDFLTNAKSVKLRRTETTRDWATLPELSSRLRHRLAIYYKAEIQGLEELAERDLSHWAPLYES